MSDDGCGGCTDKYAGVSAQDWEKMLRSLPVSAWMPPEPCTLDTEEITKLPHLIKIDAEGADLDVVRGAENLIASSRCPVVFENWKVHSLLEAEQLFNRLNMKIWSINYAGGIVPASVGDDVSDDYIAAPR